MQARAGKGLQCRPQPAVPLSCQPLAACHSLCDATKAGYAVALLQAGLALVTEVVCNSSPLLRPLKLRIESQTVQRNECVMAHVLH